MIQGPLAGTILRGTAALLLLLAAVALSPGQDATVDPLDPSAGDFLDLPLDSLTRQAYEAYQSGDYHDAARRYLELLGRDVTNGPEIYNLACCYGLMGEPELAARYLVRAFRAGFDDIGHVEWDPDFEPVRGKEVFDRVLDSIGREREREEERAGTLVLIPGRIHLQCRVRLPDGFEPDSTYPLVVGLHGFGSSHDRFVRLWDRFGDDPRFIYACPQAPYPMAGKELGYDWMTWVPGDSGAADRVRTGSEEYIVEAVRSLQDRYRTGETYLLGFSQGGMFTYTTGIRHPDLFAGLVCFGAWLDTVHLDAERLAAAGDLRVFIGHGTEDRVVEFESASTARDVLTGYGYDVTFYEYDAGHRIPEDAARAAGAWLQHPPDDR